MAQKWQGMPIFGKLSDMYGRKEILLFRFNCLYELVRALCGTAENIQQLRYLMRHSRYGGGALVPDRVLLSFDIFPTEKRGKMGGLFGAVFGLPSSSAITWRHIYRVYSWHWVFILHLPLGIFSNLFYYILFKNHAFIESKRLIGWRITLVGAVVSLMLRFELGGQKYDWGF